MKKLLQFTFLFLFIFTCSLHTMDKNKLDDNLIKAARDGDNKQVKKSLKAGVNVNTFVCDLIWDPFDDRGRLVKNEEKTPLTEAARNGHIETVRLLLEAKADVNQTGFLGRTSLFSRTPEIVLELIKAKADVNKPDNYGETPLSWVTRCKPSNKDIDIAKLLLINGAKNMPIGFRISLTPLEIAMQKGNVRDFIFKLKKYDRIHTCPSNNILFEMLFSFCRFITPFYSFERKKTRQSLAHKHKLLLRTLKEKKLSKKKTNEIIKKMRDEYHTYAAKIVLRYGIGNENTDIASSSMHLLLSGPPEYKKVWNKFINPK